MAARKLRTRHQEEVKQKIQASQIINRLQDHVLGKVELTSAQVRSAEILLKKSIPDLSAVTLGGDADNPVMTETTLNVEGLSTEALAEIMALKDAVKRD